MTTPVTQESFHGPAACVGAATDRFGTGLDGVGTGLVDVRSDIANLRVGHRELWPASPGRARPWRA